MFTSIVDTTITSLSDLQCGNGRDPAANCTQCLQGRDPATNCTQCLQGRDPATNCVMCLPGTYRVNAEAMECTALPGIQLTSSYNMAIIVIQKYW